MKRYLSNQTSFISFLLASLLMVIAFSMYASAAMADEPAPEKGYTAVVDQALLAEIETNGRASYLVYLKETADLSPAANMDWEAQGWFVYNTLREVAQRSQADIVSLLKNDDVEYKTFFIANAIQVTSGIETLNSLASHPSVASIEASKSYAVPEPERISPNSSLAIEWGVSIIRADEVWTDLGVFGAGVVVASIDTGVQYDHPALQDKYRGTHTGSNDFNFFDPSNTCTGAVCDNNGHGTHVTGTMLGDDGGANQIGVAPEAIWIAAKGCEANNCSDTSLLSSAEWMLAPCGFGDVPGDPSCDPSMRPHVLNNSWGGGGGNAWYQASVDAWRAVSIIPVFSAGNSGPGTGTIGSPSDYCNVMSIGGTNISDGMYPSSSRGPGAFPGCTDKPDISAPGQGVRSSVPTNSYATFSGTSMASPHVSGCIALMMSVAPNLDYDQIYTILTTTAEDLGAPGFDYDYGNGRIDCYEAVLEAQALSGPTGTIEGTVTADGSGDPLADVSVVAALNMTTTKSATTDGAGTYTMTFSPEGTYTMTASVFGYLPQTVSGVQVISGSVTTQDFALEQAPSHTVSGVVTDATTGWPLYASIEIIGADIDSIWTDPADGSYSIVLPEGMTYTFAVNAWVAGYETVMREVAPLTSDQTEDFGLEADLLACTAPGYTLSYFYYEDFQADDGGYTTSGATPLPWEWGEPVTWPEGCGEGTNCWGTNLTGNYANSADETVTSPVIDLTSVVTGTQLTARWYQANHIETSAWDEAYAEVSIDGGPWTTMWQNPGSTVQEPWRELSYDISAAAGTDVQFRWRLDTDGSVNYAGLYVDRVAIAEGAAACAPAAGGLLVGQVYDNNTAATLTGAMVNGEEDSTTTAETPNDSNVDDSFYTLFVPAGSSVVTASMSGGYADQVETVNITDGTTTAQDFYLNAGWLMADPTEIELTLALGDNATVPMTLTNSGNVPASYELLVGVASEDFETAFPPADWTVVNNGGTCVWQRNDAWPNSNYAGGDGFSAAADSDACGSGTTMNTELHSPALDLSGASVASLEFVASYRHLGSSSFQVHVSDDGGSNWDTLLTWTADSSAQGPGTPVSLDLTPYVGSSEVIVSFHYIAPSWDWWAQVDQVRILADAGSWLALNPSNGNIGDNSNVLVDVEVDTSNLPSPGIYTAVIAVTEDTPYMVPSIPVTLTVTASPDLALLEGTVQSTGYCDVNSFPAAGAEVVISSGVDSWTTYADGNGYYSLYINDSYSPVDIDVTAPDHEAGSATGVVLVGQQTTTEDFDLRLLAPCVSVDTASFDVELALGSVVTYTLDIMNEGGAATSFELREQDGGYAPAFLSLGTANIQDEPLSSPDLSTAEISEVGIVGNAPVNVPTAFGTAPEDIGTDWETMAALPSARVFSAVVADQNGYVYVVGGTSDGAAAIPTNTTYRYSTATNTWDTMATLPVNLDSIDGIVINNKIYIPGGASTATTYVYDIATDTWSTIAANGGYTARSQYQVVAIDSDLYVLGGIVAAAGASTTEVWMLDTVAQTWTASTPMQQTRTSFSAGVIDGEIYVAGGVAFPGFAPTMTAEKFDGATWSYIANVPDGGGAYTRWSYNADAVGPQGLWLAGGRRDAGWTVLNHAAYYDPITDTWVDSPVIPMLSQERVYMEGDVASDGYLYVIGGRDGAGATAYDTNERLFVGVPASSDVPWLSTDPVTGTVGADSNTSVSVIFDTAVLTQTGIYNGILTVVTNDTNNGTINLPITLTVSAPAPALELDVTVSTANECGTADMMYVTAGTVVYYCYTVENTGNVMLPNHTITDTVLGHIDTFVYDLHPGMSKSVIYSQTVTSSADSTAMWEASHAGLGVSAMATDDVMVMVVTPGVVVDTAVDAQSGLAGSTVTYTVHITNTGDLTDTFDIALSNETWATTAPASITLAAGEHGMFEVMVTIAADAQADDSDSVLVTATSQMDDTVMGGVTLTTTAVEPEPTVYTSYLPIVVRP